MRQEPPLLDSCKEIDVENYQSPSIRNAHDKCEGQESKDNSRRSEYVKNSYLSKDFTLSDSGMTSPYRQMILRIG